ncbi:hypothetical protein [Streptomyces sp. NPDC093568]|uniref:hypothetical protein n=1 Tax=Streptomyces sp. NPDC093568 TaxID=3366041 RepID=UPI0038059A09
MVSSSHVAMHRIFQKDPALLTRALRQVTTMQYFWRHPLAEQVREEGREEGIEQERAAKILEVLDLRGIPVPASVRERVRACSDLDLLNTWFKRAVRAEHAEDLFREDDDPGHSR